MHVDITVLLDRSGSMWDIQPDTEEGLRQFLSDQKKITGTVSLSYLKFDDDLESVFECKDIQDVDEMLLDPDGATHLYDAIAQTIVRTDKRLTGMVVPPDKVLFVIITDGGENGSKEYTHDQCLTLMEKFRTRWEMIYIAGGNDAMDEAKNLGFDEASTLTFGSTSGHSQRSIEQATRVISDAVTRFRTSDGKGFFLPEETK